jgi:acetylornithine deacetylase/succinyl-diaminopimelate desuccinylase-like protein
MAASDVVPLLRDLIRFDTSNPGGNEKPAAEYLADLFSKEGLDPKVIEGSPKRSNVIARLKGDGSKPPFLLSAHLDVVPAQEPGWKHPPFAGVLEDGYVWGRGAVDMKHMAAMSASIMIELKRRGAKLKRDLIFAGVADEEAGCRWGSKYLVDEHRELIAAEYALTELGGMAVPVGKRVVVPVQAAERGYLWLKLRAGGCAGHGSLPSGDSAVARLTQAVSRLSKKPLRYHLTPAARSFFLALAGSHGQPGASAILGLLSSATARLALNLIPAERRNSFRAMLHNTAAVTGLKAGVKVNVVPETAEAEVDARYLPGVSRQEFLDELGRVLGPEIELEVMEEGAPLEMPLESPLLDAISEVMSERLPGARVVPYLMPGMTDAKHYARAGMACYGFAPVKLKPDEPFAALYHAPNERISAEGLEAGREWLLAVVEKMCLV